MELVELTIPSHERMKDPNSLIDRWNEMNLKTKIYKTIDKWDTCSPNVLANKIKKVQSYYTELINSVKELKHQFKSDWLHIDKMIYLAWLRNADFDKLERPFVFEKIPLTWSVKKSLDENRTIEYYAKLNKYWFNFFIKWLLYHLEQL